MRLYFMLEGRRGSQVPSRVMLEVFDILTRRDFQIDVGRAEEMVIQSDRLSITHDLYLLKSGTELSLSLAGILHDQGARLLNPYPCCVVTRNKIVASRRLRAAGIPTPRSWVTGDLTLLHPIVEERPLIIKPYRGFHSAGFHILRNPDELAAVHPPDTPVLIQEYIQGTGEGVKVYVVGQGVFAVRKSFSPTGCTRPSRPCSVSAEIRDIARRCGRIFGLGLYGLDVIESPSGPVVVDLNYFPGYEGVPYAAPLIADYIEGYARGQFNLRLPRLARPVGVEDRTDAYARS